MLSYETLDAIADSYNPLLGIIALLILARTLVATRWRLAGIQALQLIVMLGIAYGLKFLDGRFGIWRMFALDYSTHTATSVALVVFLAVNAKRFAAFWISSLLTYFGLMIYQQYHTVADILTTLLAVIVPVMAATLYLRTRATTSRVH